MNLEQFSPLGDSAMLIRFGDQIDEAIHQRIVAVSSYLAEHRLPGVIEHVPCYTTIAMHYDPTTVPRDPNVPADSRTPYARLRDRLARLLAEVPAGQATESRLVEIPVCYDPEFGIDLAFVSEHCGLPPDEVIRIHAATTYRVYLIGFTPGFPYLGQVPSQISAPRRSTPRLSVPAGTVGIAGPQTGIYPVESPGGWQLIGRTPVTLFDPGQSPPALLRIGDRVRFHPVARAEFEELRASRPPA